MRGCCVVLFLLLNVVESGQAQPEAESERGLSFEEIVEGLTSGGLTLNGVRRMGLEVFSTPLTRADGYGDGPFDPTEFPPFAFGHRPTLQGNGLSLRVNGLDAQSCNECHSIVSNATLPPTLGIAGVGGLIQNAFIAPTLIDVSDSLDDRIAFWPGHEPGLPLEYDGIADFNGRFSNPPFLYGGGGVELLAKEMTLNLQRLLEEARGVVPGTITALRTHGVSFGFLRTVDELGTVDLSGVQGLGYKDNSTRPPEEVLVVRPFGRKGENFSMRDFDRVAMQFHFGIQPVEVIGEGIDGDGDGVVNEATIGQMTALHIFDVTNPRPRLEALNPAAAAGLLRFLQIGCGSCHRPVMQTESRYLPLAFPEIPHDPAANVYYEIDLVQLGFRPGLGGGVLVPLFADLKRHDMGPELAESFELGEIPDREFTTARLWGVADTAPYLHDGRATTLREAIVLHGGEAEPARNAFLALEEHQQQDVIEFLGRLRTPHNPNTELVLASPGRPRRPLR